MGSCCLQLLGCLRGRGGRARLPPLPLLPPFPLLPHHPSSSIMELFHCLESCLLTYTYLFSLSSKPVHVYIFVYKRIMANVIFHIFEISVLWVFFRIPTNFPALELSPHVSSCQSGWCKTMMLFPRGIAWCHIANFSRPFRFWLTPLGIFICSYLYISFRIPFLNSLLTPTHFWSTKLTSYIPNSFLTYQQLLSYPINFISQLSVIQAG